MKTTEQDLAHYRAVYRENGGLSKSAAEDVLDDLDSALAQLATEREARERAEQAHKYAHGVSEDWRSKHANALHEADALRAEVARKDAALEKLRYLAGRITGKVCDDYENCNHEACDASCHAHLIALEMRGDIGAALAPPGRDAEPSEKSAPGDARAWPPDAICYKCHNPVGESPHELFKTRRPICPSCAWGAITRTPVDVSARLAPAPAARPEQEE